VAKDELGDGEAGTSPGQSLAGRVALVTGGARRIGHHLVLALARQGVKVVIHYRNSLQDARDTAGAVTTTGGEVDLVEGDLANAKVAAALPEQAARCFGPPDILVNNASVFEQGSLGDTTCEEWDHHQAVNLRAPFLLSQAFSRVLPQDRTGDIINLNDYRALRPGADHFAYTISKVGLHGLTQSLALGLAPRIRVNELALGAVLPPEGAPATYVHTLKSEIPLARFGQPAEVAAALLFLLTSPTVTGQTVCIDGGRHLR
jgi:pteridine reductase